MGYTTATVRKRQIELEGVATAHVDVIFDLTELRTLSRHSGQHARGRYRSRSDANKAGLLGAVEAMIKRRSEEVAADHAAIMPGTLGGRRRAGDLLRENSFATGLHYRRVSSTKRATNPLGVVGSPVAHLEGLRTSGAIPADPSAIQGLQKATSFQTLTAIYFVFVDGSDHDIEGDRIVVDGSEYAVRTVQRWPGTGLRSPSGFCAWICRGKS